MRAQVSADFDLCYSATSFVHSHPSRPLYTPEPDICHELLGHAPMFADPDFAAFSQEIGLASLGASDEDITALARCYWHSVEFGLVKDARTGLPKAYGAGLLSSFGELAYACSGDAPREGGRSAPQLLPWDPFVAARTPFPITDYQPIYFVAESLSEGKRRMRSFCEQLTKPFYARLDPASQRIWVDRALTVVDKDSHSFTGYSGSQP